MFERFTESAREAMAFAEEEASRFGHNYIGTEHLLLGLIREGDAVAARALSDCGVNLARTRERVESIVGFGEDTSGQAPFTPRSKKVFELALREALQLRQNYIGTEHVLLGLAREGEGVAARVFSDLNVSPDRIRREIMRRIEGGSATRGGGSSRAYVSVESEGENRTERLRTAVEATEESPHLAVMAKSKIYGTEGPDDEEVPACVSRVLEVECGMSADSLLTFCQGIEATFGSVKMYLLLYGEEVVNEPNLTVPHPGVLLPRNLKGLLDVERDITIPAVKLDDLTGSVYLGSVKEVDE